MWIAVLVLLSYYWIYDNYTFDNVNFTSVRSVPNKEESVIMESTFKHLGVIGSQTATENTKILKKIIS